MSFSTPYIIFTAGLLFVSGLEIALHWSESDLRRLNFLVLVGFILFFGGSNYIGWDWTNYAEAYKDTVPLRGFLRYDGWWFNEPGFNLWMSLIRTFTTDYHIFFFVTTLLNACLLHIFFNRYVPRKYYAFAMAIFLVVYGFTYATDLMRNFTGMMLFLFALPYIEKRQWYFFFPIVLAGALFHWSIALLSICYFFLHLRIPRWAMLSIFILGNIVFLWGMPIVSSIIKMIANFFPTEQHDMILDYVDNSVFGKEYGISLGFLERTLIAVLVFLYYPQMTETAGKRLFVNAFFIFVFVCLYCYEYSIFITRLGALFGFGSWVIYPALLSCLDRPLKAAYWLVLSAMILLKINSLTDNILYKYENVIFDYPYSTYKQKRIIFNENKERLFK